MQGVNTKKIAARDGWSAVPAVAAGRICEIKSTVILQLARRRSSRASGKFTRPRARRRRRIDPATSYAKRNVVPKLSTVT